MPLDRADWERLKEIREQMGDLFEEAKNLVRLSCNTHEYERAKAYWLGYLDNALDGPKSPLLPCTMGDTIKALAPTDEDEDDEEYEDSDEGTGSSDSGNSG